MSFNKILFPEESRFFEGQRWANVIFRTLHLVGLAGVGAGFFYPAVDDSWRLYFWLTMISGVGLMLISIWSNGIWLVQLRGQAIMLKLLLLALIPLLPDFRAALFLSVIVISGLISHAPANTRYYSLIHRRRIDRL
ncbi:MAG: hypothetical protein ABW168_26040 [Sedimenticola sp.]